METISEEQVLHNQLSFEINTELIHLMKRIVEIQRTNEILQKRIDKALQELDAYRINFDFIGFTDKTIINTRKILRGGNNE